ncbi:hypothetical protein [Stenotrophomonas sp. JAG2]|uniref:hypothetical protein n=1 Tax=Stenotrophomonas sp. JAG2 TaxID=3229243 RepID=UPI0034E1AF9B
MKNWNIKSIAWIAVSAVLLSSLTTLSHAQESVCARVKIEIKQELTLERQAFDAEMRITNSLPTVPLTQVEVDVRVTDETGAPVTVTTDPNDLTARFFIRQTHNDTAADGQVKGNSTAVLNWLLIPAPGSAGNTPAGKRYLVGATLRYRYGNETQEMVLSPDSILVKPMPALTLDYFLTRDVVGDDPFTQEVEAPEPYTLGVRVRNSGMADAKKLKVDSAQPKIIDNQQGLAINFVLLGSYVQDAPVNNSLLIDFGDIAAKSAKMGRWVMESNLAGTFVEFDARFTHSDELGGALTSLLEATNAHLLVRDVRVDLPGRDMVRDFLAQDGTRYTVYESDNVDADVTDRSREATLVAASGGYKLSMAASQGFLYVRLPDPYRGQMALGPVQRGDAKAIAAENVWLSRTRNADTKQWEYWFNLFDVNSPGNYQVGFKPHDAVPRAPVLQFVPDRVVKEGETLSFLVEGSSPMGRKVTLAASPLPVGALFKDQGDGTAVFDWTPDTGQSGTYAIQYVVSDGAMQGARSAAIRVESKAPPAGPAIPTIDSPLPGAQVASLRPSLQVKGSEATNDPTTAMVFELYADAAMTVRLSEGRVARPVDRTVPVQWQLEVDLDDNTNYWWRVRAASADLFSEWANGAFFVNLFNDAPEAFNLTTPEANADVATLTPTLAATNAADVDGDAITYMFEVFSDATLSNVHERIADLAPGGQGTTSWTVTVPLTNHARYWWRATAVDSHGARTQTPARAFRVMTGNATPTDPVIASPLPGARVSTEGAALLKVRNSIDADGDPISYVFEIDVVNTFDSSSRQTSPAIAADSSGSTGWQVTGLVENQHYYWRVKASDGHSQTGWVLGDFVLDARNEAPPAPTIANPGDRAWVTTLYPTFTANPVEDPEGDPVLYAFEVYTDAALGARVASGTSGMTSWKPTSPLRDATTHYWRVRAQDGRGAASEWSPVATVFVSTSSYTAPTIAVTSPGTLTDASGGSVTITWTGTDPNIDPRIALYYDRTGSGFAGTRIVEGLRQDAGTHTGSHVWTTAGLAAGTYYIYGVIYDERGSSRAYAPGVVVVPHSPQAGVIKVSAPGTIRINETLGVAMFTVTLGSAPNADVQVPLASSDITEATVSPKQMTFNRSNWWVPQIASIRAEVDNVRDGDQPFVVSIGNAISSDPQYMGVAAHPLNGITVDNGIHTSIDGLSVSYKRVSKSYSSLLRRWTYRYRLVINNSGPRVNSVTATIDSAPGYTVVLGTLIYGSIGQGESSTSVGEFVLMSPTDFGDEAPKLSLKLKAL